MAPRVLAVVLLAVGCVAAGTGGDAAPPRDLDDPAKERDPPDEGALLATDLRCEYLVDPLAIDTPAPRLSWALRSADRGQRQTAYEIVATTGGVVVWSTGKVASDRQSQIPYAGRPLASGQEVRWTVRVWDRQGRPAPAAAEASFEMGLLAPGDWKGRWIGATTALAPAPAPHLRRTFEVSRPVRRARVYIAGLGYGELHLNGQKVGDHVLDPGFTRFDRRVLYVVHDVTGLVRVGRNTAGVILGNGFLNQHAPDAWGFEKAPWRMAPRLLMQIRLDYEDGGREEVAVSDGSWKVAAGPIRFDGIRNGERYDARAELPGWDTPAYVEDAGWTPALVVPAPGGVLSAAALAPQKVTRTLAPREIREPAPGVFVADFGENIAGWAQLTVTGPRGAEVQMRYGERLTPDGDVDQGDVARFTKVGPIATDRYTLKGEGVEVWEPRFVYHGFQFVELTGFPGRPTTGSLRARVVNTAFDQIGRFASSSAVVDRLYEATLRSYRANFQSIPTDCPHREKMGWMADAHLAAEQAMFTVDNAAGYTKWVRDIRDEMRADGALPGIVPTGGWGYTWGNGPAWDGALFLVPWYLYRYLGDTRILTDSYEHFKRYLHHVETRPYLVKNPDGWIGDWLAPDDAHTPEAVTHAGYHAVFARITAATARLAGKPEEASRYEALAAAVVDAFREHYLHGGKVATGSQTSSLAALYDDLLPPADRPRVMEQLLADIARHGEHLDTGVLGAKYLPWVLTDGGHADVFYRLATRPDGPSWGAFIAQGATTLWEDWVGDESRNHVFLGDITAWFFRGLAGINVASPGFSRIAFRPEVVGDLRFVDAETRSLRGPIGCAWTRTIEGLTLTVTVPPNSTATVAVPATSPDEVRADAGAVFLKREAGRQVYGVESGRYRFTVRPASGPTAGNK